MLGRDVYQGFSVPTDDEMLAEFELNLIARSIGLTVRELEELYDREAATIEAW